MVTDGVGKHPEWLLSLDGNTGLGKMTVTGMKFLNLLKFIIRFQ